MSKDWQKGLKGVFEKGKEKLDEGYEKVKEAEKKRSIEKARKDAEKAEQRRREEIKENRRKRQEERRRIQREERFGKTMLRSKIVCTIGVAIWACWFITDFAWHYDEWIAKYHKWTIEYEAQAPSRAEAKAKYEEKERLEAIAREEKRKEEERKRQNEIAREEARQREEFRKEESTSQYQYNPLHSGKTEEQLARDLADSYNNLDMKDPNFDVGGYCREQERKGKLTFQECMGAALLKAAAQ